MSDKLSKLSNEDLVRLYRRLDAKYWRKMELWHYEGDIKAKNEADRIERLQSHILTETNKRKLWHWRELSRS